MNTNSLPEKDIISEYIRGVDQVALAREYGTTTYYIRKVLKKSNTPIRSFQEAASMRNKKLYSRANGPCYKSGIGIYTKVMYEDLKRERKCIKCGISEGRIVIHHLDMNRENNSPDNLHVLCERCHRLRHSKIEPIRDVLKLRAISMYLCDGLSSSNIAKCLGVSYRVVRDILHDAGVMRTRSEANTVRGYTLRGESWHPQ